MYKTTPADVSNIADLRATADIVEEKDELTTYLGFCQPNTESETDSTWSIMKIVQSGTAKPVITKFQWADGLCSFTHNWSLRLTYDYKFKKF